MTARDAWLEQRRAGIGGSDAAAALGQSPHMTQLELYHLKIGTPLGPRDTDEERTEFGRAMEGVIASQYARRYDVRVRRRNSIIRHPTHEFMLANVDRVIEGKKRGLECKNVDSLAFRFNDEWGEELTDRVPTPYLLQCAHYMSVLNYPEWDLAACVGGNRLVIFHLVRDLELEDMIIEGEFRFWQHVIKREPPPMDFEHPTALRFMRRLYAGTSGETVLLPEDAERWHRLKKQGDARVKRATKLVDACKARILESMGTCAVGVIPNVGEYVRRSVHRPGYTVEACDYETLNFRKPKGPTAKARTSGE